LLSFGNAAEQVDRLDLESLQRTLHNPLDVLRLAIHSGRTLHPARIEIRIQVEPKFGGDRHLSAKGSEGFTHKLFVRERTVDLGSVKECDAARQQPEEALSSPACL
jgi:hypothetical protein